MYNLDSESELANVISTYHMISRSDVGRSNGCKVMSVFHILFFIIFAMICYIHTGKSEKSMLESNPRLLELDKHIKCKTRKHNVSLDFYEDKAE